VSADRPNAGTSAGGPGGVAGVSDQLAKPTPAPLLDARSLTRHYPVSRGWLQPKALVRALDGVSFTLQQARTLAVVGESGCAKST
jgi:dipeptide transport system ATP-binding protein